MATDLAAQQIDMTLLNTQSGHVEHYIDHKSTGSLDTTPSNVLLYLRVTRPRRRKRGCRKQAIIEDFW